MNTREQSIATWCKRFQIDLGRLSDRMKIGELTVFEKRKDGKLDITTAVIATINQAIREIEAVLLDE